MITDLTSEIAAQVRIETPSRLCPMCDDPGGTVEYLGQHFHPVCAELFRREYEAAFEAKEEGTI